MTVRIIMESHSNCAAMTDDQLCDMIEEISDRLDGCGIGQLDRLALHADRKAARAELARRIASRPA